MKYTLKWDGSLPLHLACYALNSDVKNLACYAQETTMKKCFYTDTTQTTSLFSQLMYLIFYSYMQNQLSFVLLVHYVVQFRE
jgi:hypothetical protein